MVVLGGMGNVWGVIARRAGAGLGQLDRAGADRGRSRQRRHRHASINFPSYNFLIFGGVLVLMMLFRREGLLPEARTRLVLREPEPTRSRVARAPTLEEHRRRSWPRRHRAGDARLTTARADRARWTVRPAPDGRPALRAEHITVHFGGLIAVNDVELHRPRPGRSSA